MENTTRDALKITIELIVIFLILYLIPLFIEIPD